MNIGLDVDDTLAAFQVKWLAYHNNLYGTHFSLSDINDYDYSKTMKIPWEVAVERVLEFYKTKDFKEIMPVDGAVETVSQWNDHSLFIITSRPDSTKRLTHAWVKRHFPNRISKFIFTNQFRVNENTPCLTKADVAKELKLDFMIEDTLKHAVDISSVNVHVILLNKPWNQTSEKFEKITRVNSWDEVRDIIN